MPEDARGAWRRQARLRRPMPLPVSCSAPVKVPALVKSVKYFKLMVPDDTFFFFFFSYASDFSLKSFKAKLREHFITAYCFLVIEVISHWIKCLVCTSEILF